MSQNDDDSPKAPESGDAPRSPETVDQAWWGEGVPRDVVANRYKKQLEIIIQGLEERLPPRTHDDVETPRVGVYPDTGRLEDADFICRNDQILTRDGDVARVLEVLELDPSAARPSRGSPNPINGLTVLSLARLRPKGRRRESLAEQALQTLDDEIGPGVANFDRAIHLTTSSACPATEPVPAHRPPVPAETCHRWLGREVKVAVIDTGIPIGENHRRISLQGYPWLRDGVSGGPEDSAVGHYRGHGMFVAGVLRTMAPQASVYVHPFIYTSGGTFESTLAPSLVQAFQTRPDIISMSAGTDLPGGVVPEAGPGSVASGSARHRPLSFDVFYEEYLRGSNTVLVCAAGNSASRGPFEPASLSWTVSVGALDADGKRAGYSNWGHWIDVFARGSDMINAYPRSEHLYEETRGLENARAAFPDGMAKWSGTSFSTPLVAGLIAARMSWSGENAPQAWASLARIAASKARDGMWILDPGDADPGVQPPRY